VAARKLARQRRLEQQEATSANAVDDALLEQRLASAELAAARLWLTGIGATPSGAAAVSVRVPVRSPMDGVVSARHVVLGGSVTPEHALFEIRSIDSSVVVVVHVPETAPTLVGDEAMLTPRGAMTQRCRARVVGGLGVIDERTRSRVVRLAPSALCAGLLPGGFVTASFVGKPRSDGDATSDDLVVPNEAVVDVRGVEMVFVASDARGAFIAHPVTVGARNLDDVTIAHGLLVTDRIALRGASLLRAELLRSELLP
jgi:cobalt-zinc-cadmium efflux system membrane fusion protein